MYFYWIDLVYYGTCLDTCPIFFKEDLQGSKSENESGAKHFFLFFSIEILDDHLIV